jgi:hypothetical protein
MSVATSSRYTNRYTKPTSRRSSALSKIAPILVTGFGFVSFAMVVPANTSAKTEARIFSQGLSIQIDRSSPAYAALEDTLEANTQNTVEQSPEIPVNVPARTIASGPAYTEQEPVALRIVREVRREESLLAQERSQRYANSRVLVSALSHALPKTVVNHPTQSISKKEAAALFALLAQGSKSARVPRHPSFVSMPRPSAPIVTAARVAFDKSLDRSTEGRAAQQAEPENPNTDVHQLVISGPVEFAGGIAITNSNDRVVIYRENDEEKMEPAQVWLRDAKYEIFVDQPVGRLVGELRSASGDLLGRGTFNLSTLPRLASNQYRIDKVALTIGPIPHGIIGNVATAPLASEANPKARVLPVKNAHVQLGQLPFDTVTKKDGTFKDDNLTEGSLVILHADRPGHWGSLGYSVAGWPTELPMFTDATVRAIMAAATGSDHENTRNTAIVWGRVTRSGLPVAGAKVDLMTSEARAVYFNENLLPDPALKTTSANGLYAFFPLEPGAHAVQAAEGHSITEPSLFPADQQTTTQVNLELSVTRSAKIRVYDAFKTDWPLSAEVITAGRKRGAFVPKSGETKVTFTGGNGVMFLDADAGSSYERVRVTALKSQTKIDFPMVQTLWISRIEGALRVNHDVRSGTVVGFIRGTSAYQVSLESGSLGPNTRIVYFDGHGEITGRSYGEAGGGFMILNVPQGFRTVLIQPAGANAKALATAVLIEDRVTNVINKTF